MDKNRNNIFFTIFVGLVIFSLVFMGFVSSFRLAKKEYDVFPRETDHILGDLNKAKIVVIEYSDFECPACQSFYPIVKSLKEKYKDEVVFIYRHLPLIEIHPKALMAAQAAEAASKQGKFWEMHNLLFEKQAEWKNSPNPKELFLSYAKTLNLDLDKFKKDFENQEIKEKILNERSEALKLGLQGTPSFFVNRKLVTLTSYDSLEKEIEKELANQK